MQVTVAGIGPLRAGMSVRDAATALHDSLTLPVGADTSACGTLAWRGGPPGVSVMFEHDRVARVDIRSGSVATDAGARIGDTESRIHSLYPGRVAVTPRKYTSGHYLTVSPAAAADSAFRIIFETDGVRVTGYRAGMLPQVAYVEGCG